MTRTVVSGDESSARATRGQHGLPGQLVPPDYANLTEPLSHESGLKLGFLPAPREVVARKSQWQAVMPGVPKDHCVSAVKADLWDRPGRDEFKSTCMGT
jgi:hypothetical protein